MISCSPTARSCCRTSEWSAARWASERADRSVLGFGETLPAAETIVCEGHWIMPGLIDPHVHFGFGSPETDFLTESRSAALGGVTTVISFHRSADFENPWPRPASAAFAERDRLRPPFRHHQPHPRRTLAECSQRFGVLVIQALPDVQRHGRTRQGVHRDRRRPALRGLAAGRARSRRRAGRALRERGSEPGSPRGPLRAAGRDDLGAWDDQSPDFLEAENVHRVCYFAGKVGCAVNIVHLQRREALDEARRHRRRKPAPIYLETCPQYLFLTRTRAGVLAKVNPPLRIRATWTRCGKAFWMDR